jgi:transcription termination factor Rho
MTDRNPANSRIYPAINLAESGTCKEKKLLDERTLAGNRNIRRHLMNMPPARAMKNLVEALGKHPTNESLFKTMKA